MLSGKHVVVVGSGHSAMTAVIELAQLASQRSGDESHVGAAARCGG